MKNENKKGRKPTWRYSNTSRVYLHDESEGRNPSEKHKRPKDEAIESKPTVSLSKTSNPSPNAQKTY
jgi:hypothetical protein